MEKAENKNASILVVDDDRYIAEVIKCALEDEGYSVLLAYNGLTALSSFDQNKVDLVLLDIKMPGLDGYQILSKIREKSDIPVIMLTCVHEAEAVAQSVQLGADDYVRKPFLIQELIARVRAKLRRARSPKY
jgi:DNA-binding response OmpR family regulator